VKTLVTIATLDRRDQAEALVNRLREAGVEADYVDDTDTQSEMLVGRPRGAFRVEAGEGDTARAEGLVREWDRGGGAVIRCPQCGGSQLEYPQMTRKFPAPLWAFALLQKVGFLKPEFYCERCHHTWPPEPPKPEDPNDILYWRRKDPS
jgi:hypothetical protein